MDITHLARALEALRTGTAVPEHPWLAALRTNCVALSEADPRALSAISVTTQMTDDSSPEASAVRTVSQLLADEFDFVADVAICGRAISVRFARHEPCDRAS